MTAFRDISWTKKASEITIVANSFVWIVISFNVFLGVLHTLEILESEKLLLAAIYYVALTISAVLGARTFPSERKSLLQNWFLVSAAASLLLIFISNNLLMNSFIVIFFGFATGIGLPSCMSYFADSTINEKRGLTSGVVWSIIGFSILLFAYAISVLATWQTFMLLTLWRLVGGLCFSLFKTEPLNLSL